MKKLVNKTAVITGGASGIGKATVELFVKEGANVVIADFSESGKQLEKELNDQGYQTLFIKVDVIHEDQIKEMFAKTADRFGQLDILYANAGIANDGDIDTLDYDKWKRTIDINLNGVFLSDKYAIIQMLKQGTGGTIVNAGSIHSFVGKKGVTAYASAKGGVKLLTQTLGATYARQGIRVNAVAPGYIDTPLIYGANKDELIQLHPMGRLGRPEEVAKAVLFLASEDSSFISGTELLIDGGYTAI
ncbi:SDR family NAD(P)-dependent oxidoreductase [Apibacter sp. HY039]|uniref:SDR family NAD(P)-dependent oxidoreductase n=1 Tax=Apibacter sp. HY039 TaxID=2501476 RepID=UPI000FEBA6FE|nr:SDR family NAD(P)-dependent oxidoreductase [Apibacter sp. HY039]